MPARCSGFPSLFHSVFNFFFSVVLLGFALQAQFNKIKFFVVQPPLLDRACAPMRASVHTRDQSDFLFSLLCQIVSMHLCTRLS
jgi:hypothetical protein